MAKLWYYKRDITDEGDIIRIKIWEVEKSKSFPHGIRYFYVYIHKGLRIFGYDNERAKGDHMHIFNKEEPYTFISIDKLSEDFEDGVKKIRMRLYGSKED